MKFIVLFSLLLSAMACGSETQKNDPTISINTSTNNSTSGSTNNTSSSNNTSGSTNNTSGSNNALSETQSDCEGYETAIDGVCQLVNFVEISAYASDDKRTMRQTLGTSVCTVDASTPNSKPLTYRFDDGLCRVFFFEDRSTDPNPTLPSLDAGEVTLNKPSGDVIYRQNPESSCYESNADGDTPGFTIGEKIEVSAKGGSDFEAFSVNFNAPTHLSGVTFTPFNPNANLNVSWDTRGEIWASVILTAVSTDPDESVVAIFCTTRESTGTLTVVKEAINLLPKNLLSVTANVTVSESQNQKAGTTVVRLSKRAINTSDLVDNRDR